MLKQSIILASAVVLVGVAGCNPKPVAIRDVPASVLPVEARELLVEEAKIVRVEEQEFGGGQMIYRIHYELEGKERTVDYNGKKETEPSGVLESK